MPCSNGRVGCVRSVHQEVKDVDKLVMNFDSSVCMAQVSVPRTLHRLHAMLHVGYIRDNICSQGEILIGLRCAAVQQAIHSGKPVCLAILRMVHHEHTTTCTWRLVVRVHCSGQRLKGCTRWCVPVSPYRRKPYGTYKMKPSEWSALLRSKNSSSYLASS